MRNAIREYLGLSDSEKQDLLETATIVFDTNILLNLYRCSKSTRDELLVIMESFRDRLWIPHQVAYEFMENRPEVIFQTAGTYSKMTDSANKLIKSFAELLRIKENDESCQELKRVIHSWIERKKAINLEITSCSDDKLLSRILDLFDGKVGKEYSTTDLEKLKREGKERYDRQIPPGYKDRKKDRGNDDNNAYGDFIYWKQILDYAKGQSVDIVLVTDDQKDDWWNEKSGRTIGPRPELQKEFYLETGKMFHMYSMEQFMSIAGKTPNEQVMEEIRSISSNPLFQGIGVVEIGFSSDTILELEQELYELRAKNKSRYQSLLGYENLLSKGNMTQKQYAQYHHIRKIISRDERKIQEIVERIEKQRLSGLANQIRF